MSVLNYHILQLLTFLSTQADELPDTNLTVENLALNNTGITIQEMVILSEIMPVLKELHLCGNGMYVNK